MRRAAGVVVLAGGLSAALSGVARGDGDFIVVSPAGVPSFVGGGIGGIPDYIGSDEYTIGAAPFGRYSWGERYVDIQANFLSANLLDHPNWRVGPAGVLRLGRRNVDDPVVDRLGDIDYSFDLGAFVAYELADAAEPRDRWVFAADATHDVTGGHDGFTASASVRKWFPVRDFAALGVSVATTYGSGNYMDTYFSVLPAGAAASGLLPFAADAGMRDVRLTAAFVQPLSERWLLAGGVMYKRLVGDAADTPITDVRGSANQVIFGVGIAFVLP